MDRESWSDHTTILHVALASLQHCNVNRLQLADDNKTLKMLEDTILRLLSESSGNILDDEVGSRMCHTL
eukprot:962410-Amphidinium_carterae.2